MKKRKVSVIAIFLIIVFITFLSKIVNITINLKWFKEVGYLSVYLTKLFTILKIAIPVLIISFMAIHFYFKSIKKSIISLNNITELNSIKEKRIKKYFFIGNIIVSLFIAASFSIRYWYKILQFMNGQIFNIKDPIFNIDISFFMFKLPFIELIYDGVTSFLIFLAFITVIIYIALNIKDRIIFNKTNIPGNVYNLNNFKSGLTKFAGKQLAVLGALLLIFISLGYAIKTWNLVYSPRGVAFGASYTDTKITLKFYKAIVVVSIVLAIVVFVSILKSKIKPIIASFLIIVVLIFGESITSNLWQQFVVKSNEKRLETPFIEYNMEYTKKAFAIDNIEQKAYPLTNNLNKDIIAKNKDTIDNIKINSVSQALEFYNQVESKKNYYNFNDIDIDRYKINGKYNQVFIAPREIEYDKLQQKANTWQNKHLTYTHGYGVVMSKVNSVTTEGKPSFIIKEMPLINNSGIELKDPRIYYGEKANEYAIVNTRLDEMDYPKETGENITKNYTGESGIKMNFFNRILFAINQKDIKFILSNDITSNSRILIRRNILNRVKTIAPFLQYDNNPYIVINNGRLYWIIDGYTTSSRYPFSEPNKGINYMRNSFKVIIDAVNGTTDFYLVDKKDPVAMTYSNIFPNLFKDISTLPKGFKEHFKYPQDYFFEQCKVMERYHVNDASSFFAGQNVWDISKTQKDVEGKQAVNEGSYTIMKLPGHDKEEMVLLQYFNQFQRENMVALFAARMDKDSYGKLILYKFPTTSTETVNSPILFKQKVKQDTTISKELSLWDSKGSQVQFGDTMIIPIENTLLYIEPLYLRADAEKSIPEMKRIIVSYGDKMILATNIQEALKQLFDYNSENNQGDKVINKLNQKLDSNVDSKIKQAKDIYNKAIESQKSGDWSKYGEYINNLGEILNDLHK